MIKRSWILFFTVMAVLCVYPGADAPAASAGRKSGPKRTGTLAPGKNINVTFDSLGRGGSRPGRYQKPSPGRKREYPRTADLKISLLSRGDSVVIRWAVSTPGGWITANKAGYVVERLQVDTLFSSGQKVVLTPEPLKPWTLEEWKSRSSGNDMFAAIAAQCLYGKSAVKEFSSAASESEFAGNLRDAATELSNRHGFALFAADLDARAAEGLALRFVDRAAQPGKKYIYNVRVAEQDTTYYINDAQAASNPGMDDPAPGAPAGLKLEGLEGKIRLAWDNAEIEGFTAYNIYRSDDAGKTYKKLNKSPVVPMEPEKSGQENASKIIKGIFTDTTVVNYKEYKYCIRGISSFAEEGSCSEVSGMARDLTPPPPPKVEAVQTGRNTVRVSWKEDDKCGDVAGYYVSRSGDLESGFMRLHGEMTGKNTREFIDENAREDEPYYIVTAVDTAGNRASSNPFAAMIVDSMPPSKPKGLCGTIDSNGIVTLWWDLGPEVNLLGYRVLMANDTTHEFTPVSGTEVQDTAFRDSVTLGTLSRHVYYRIYAVNRRHMPSEVSDILAMERPDRYPPQPAVFTDYKVTDSTIELKWEHSRSDDAESQRVLRRVAGTRDWAMLGSEIAPDKGEYSDKDVTGGTLYEYAIETTDAGGLKSTTRDNVRARAAAAPVSASMKGMKGEYDEKCSCIRLKWGKPVIPAGAESLLTIYRAYSREGAAEPVMYCSLEAGTVEYTDKMVSGKGDYRYILKVVSAGRTIGECETSITVK